MRGRALRPESGIPDLRPTGVQRRLALLGSSSAWLHVTSGRTTIVSAPSAGLLLTLFSEICVRCSASSVTGTSEPGPVRGTARAGVTRGLPRHSSRTLRRPGAFDRQTSSVFFRPCEVFASGVVDHFPCGSRRRQSVVQAPDEVTRQRIRRRESLVAAAAHASRRGRSSYLAPIAVLRQTQV